MAGIVNTAASSVEHFIRWVWWIIIASVIITTLIEIYDSYRKAKISI
jgi:hypothetical protein